MSAFERYNIKYLSPSMIAQWDAAPATLILRRVFGVKTVATPSMARGNAVEAGLMAALRGQSAEQARAFACDHFWKQVDGEISDETQQAAAEVPLMLEQAIEAASATSSPLMATQLTIEHFIDDVSAPFFGKMDFVFEDKSIFELKTTTRAPSSIDTISTSHRWQAGLYAAARQQPVQLIYVTTKKHVIHTIEPGDEKQATMRLSALAMQRAFQRAADGNALLDGLPMNVDSFYWDEGMLSSYQDALSGKLKSLAGPGAEELAAQGIITFGKHAGKHISDVPRSYLNWLLAPKLSDGTVFEVPRALQEAIYDHIGETI